MSYKVVSLFFKTSFIKFSRFTDLTSLLNDNLVETLSAIYKELFADAEIRFPKMPLQKICNKIGSGATPKGGKAAYISEGISLIRSTNVFDFNFEYGELAHINQSQADALANVIVKPNDVLFNITGVSVARCCMVPADVLPARVNQHVMIVRPIMGETMSYYIMFTLCSIDNKTKLLGIGQSGSTREAINKQELESFEIPIPDETMLNQFGSLTSCRAAEDSHFTSQRSWALPPLPHTHQSPLLLKSFCSMAFLVPEETRPLAASGTLLSINYSKVKS